MGTARQHALLLRSKADERGGPPAVATATGDNGHTLIVEGPDILSGVKAVPGTYFDGPEEFELRLRQLDEALRSKCCSRRRDV